MPTFWVTRNGNRHQLVVEHLFATTEYLLKAVGVESSEDDDHLPSDTDGIDMLADAVVAGVLTWIQPGPISNLVSEYWYRPYVELIRLLRGHVSSLYDPSR